MAILDADKEGFLRSETSLIQTMGRAARNVNGKVIMYADNITDSMQRAMDETARRRDIQMRYNKEHSIVPQPVKKEIRDVIDIHKGGVEKKSSAKKLSPSDINKEIQRLTAEMQAAAKALNFEQAAVIRDMIIQLKTQK